MSTELTNDGSMDSMVVGEPQPQPQPQQQPFDEQNIAVLPAQDSNSSRSGRRSYALDSDDEFNPLKTSSGSTSAPGPPSTTFSVDSDEDDEDMRVAKALAMAIAQNPNLSPAELKELTKSTRTSAATAAATMKGKSPKFKTKVANKLTKGVKSSKSTVKSMFKAAEKSIVKSTGLSSLSSSSSDKQKAAAATAAATQDRKSNVISAAATAATAAANPPPSRSTTSTTTTMIPPILENSELPISVDGSNTKMATPVLGDFIETNQPSTTRDDRSDFGAEDSAFSASNMPSTLSPTQIRMMGIVWKRRSGLGKYSVSAAWERRRIVLKGSKLMYYRTSVDKKDGHQSNDDGASETSCEEPELMDMMTAPFPTNNVESSSSKGKSWYMTATSLSNTLVGGASATSGVGGNTASATDANAMKTTKGARGYIDLIKETASVGASFGHSGSPTPFALSIKVLAQTKWKLCFDTHAELMHWVAAMTDVIVQGSVDSYNSQILQAHDPSATSYTGIVSSVGGGGDGTYQGQLSEPPMIASSGSKEGAGGHRLWVSGHYNVKSYNFPESLGDISEEELDGESSSDSDSEDENRNNRSTAAAGSLVLEMDPNSGRDVWSVPAEHILQVGAVLNLAICLSRASSTSVENFWYLIVLTNICVFGFLTKERVGGTVKPGGVILTRKMARRMSSHMVAVETEPSKKKKAQNTVDTIAVSKSSAGFMPVAGTTTMRIESPTDLPISKDGHVFAGWRLASPSDMAVRSHGYKVTKKKVSSPGELYKCARVDVFESRTRLPDMASRVVLPTVAFSAEGVKTWNAPDIFVVSIAVPTDPPKLYSSSEDGGGYTVTMYFTMHQDTRDILKKVTADGYNSAAEKCDDVQKSKINAVRLFEEWCRRAPNDDNFMARFKVVPNAQNLREIGLPTWISKYNAKPFLIKRPGQTGFLFRHPDRSCLEFDISLHPFPYLAKQGICFMRDTYFKKVLVTFGFLIEGRSDDELPECLIGSMQLCYPDPVYAIQGEDFLAGKSVGSSQPQEA